METMNDFEFVLYLLIAVDQRIHEIFFLASLPLPHDSVKHLALAQHLEDNGFLEVDEPKVE